MPSAQGIRAGRAFVELFADDSKLVRGLRAAEKRLRDFGKRIRAFGLRLAAIGSAIVAPMLLAVRAFTTAGDRLAKMSLRTGMSVETLSALSFAAEQSGATLEALETSVARMQRTIDDAGRGLATAKDALNRLGLSFAALRKLAPEQQFLLIGERLSYVQDASERAALAMVIFGRSGTALLPLLEQGADGVRRLMNEARELGIVMSKEDAEAAVRWADAQNRLKRIFDMAVLRVGAALIEPLERLARVFQRVAENINDWVGRNKQLIRVVGLVGVALVGAGAFLTQFGFSVAGLASLIHILIAPLRLIGTVLAFIASPVGLVTAAVAALGGYLIYASGAGGKALAWLGDRFQTLKDDAVAAYGGIADALAAGDMSLAVKILWLTLKMEWTRGVNFLEKAWLDFRNFFIRVGYDAWHGLLAAVDMIWHQLVVGWIETTAWFSKAWMDFTSFFARTWERIKSGAKKAWNWIKSLFDDSFDLAAENKLVEREKRSAIARIEDESQRTRARREAERQAERAGETKRHRQRLAKISRDNLAKHRALDEQYDRKMAENEADLAKARKEWQDAIATARKKREAKEGGPERLKAPDELKDAIAGIGAALKRATTRGTFYAFAVGGLDVANDAMRITAENTGRMARRLDDIYRRGGPAFG